MLTPAGPIGDLGGLPAGGSNSTTFLTSPHVAPAATGISAAQASLGLGPPPTLVSTGFVTPHNYTTLVKNYQFNGVSLPTDWHAIPDTVFNYAPANVEYTAPMVVMNGSAVQMNIATTTDSGFLYKAGAIGTISGGTGTTIGTPTYFFTNGRVRYRAKMPSFSGGANADGLWPACWMTSLAGLSPADEIDICEMNMTLPTTAWGTLHQWKPLPTWTSNGGTSFNGTISSNASAAFHVYEAVWEPGMVSWAVDNVVFAQYTHAQATAAGNNWGVDTAQEVYLIANLAVTPGAYFGGATYSPANNAQLPNCNLQISDVLVYQ